MYNSFMYTVLGRNQGNRVVYDEGVSFAPQMAKNCEAYRQAIISIPELRVALHDKYLSEADISIVALRACVRCHQMSKTAPCIIENLSLPQLTT